MGHGDREAGDLPSLLNQVMHPRAVLLQLVSNCRRKAGVGGMRDLHAAEHTLLRPRLRKAFFEGAGASV